MNVAVPSAKFIFLLCFVEMTLACTESSLLLGQDFLLCVQLRADSSPAACNSVTALSAKCRSPAVSKGRGAKTTKSTAREHSGPTGARPRCLPASDSQAPRWGRLRVGGLCPGSPVALSVVSCSSRETRRSALLSC